ncbi:hypothetical protein ACFX19_027511 [Malus domestica]
MARLLRRCSSSPLAVPTTPAPHVRSSTTLNKYRSLFLTQPYEIGQLFSGYPRNYRKAESNLMIDDAEKTCD